MLYVVKTYYKKHNFLDGYTFKSKNNLTALAHVGHKLRLDSYGVRKAKITIRAV